MFGFSQIAMLIMPRPRHRASRATRLALRQLDLLEDKSRRISRSERDSRLGSLLFFKTRVTRRASHEIVCKIVCNSIGARPESSPRRYLDKFRRRSWEMSGSPEPGNLRLSFTAKSSRLRPPRRTADKKNFIITVTCVRVLTVGLGLLLDRFVALIPSARRNAVIAEISFTRHARGLVSLTRCISTRASRTDRSS